MVVLFFFFIRKKRFALAYAKVMKDGNHQYVVAGKAVGDSRYGRVLLGLAKIII